MLFLNVLWTLSILQKLLKAYQEPNTQASGLPLVAQLGWETKMLPRSQRFPCYLYLDLCNLNRAQLPASVITCVMKKSAVGTAPQGILTSQEQPPTQAQPEGEKPFRILLIPHSNAAKHILLTSATYDFLI